MALADAVNDKLAGGKGKGSRAPKPKRGLEIFEGTDYPTSWGGFVGQADAVAQLQVAVISAKTRGVPLDHTLIAAGASGVGKTTLAKIIAYEMGAGLIEVSGALTIDEARDIFANMLPGDVLFWDEIHMGVAKAKSQIEWLLPLLVEGVLMTSRGPEPVPPFTMIAATTDVGKLPITIINRFMNRPHMIGYSLADAVEIANRLCDRMKVRINNKPAMEKIAKASNHNPREMRMILTKIRDIAIAMGKVDLQLAFKWAGVTADGLSRLSVDYLITLESLFDGLASLQSMSAALGEPGPLTHVEQLLIQKGMIEITPRGRALTEAGLARAGELIKEAAA